MKREYSDRLMMILPTFMLIWLQLAGAQPTGDTIDKPYSIIKSLPDGELQRIVRWNGVCAREIIVDWGKTYLTLREVWMNNAHVKLNLVYQERILTDCTEDSIKNDHKDVCTSEFEWATQSGHHQVKVSVNTYGNGTNADEEIPKEFPWLSGSVDVMRQMCARAQDTRPLSVEKSQARTKRGIRELVIAPGTKWCGPHRLAYSYKDLGALDGLDRCCRRHDHCPRAITPFSEDYGFFNYMPFTLSHCGCDDRFRTCLKMTSTPSANLIGKIFFNMVQTKCFVLKPAKVCVKRSWWGKCEKHKYKKQAFLRDNIPY